MTTILFLFFKFNLFFCALMVPNSINPIHSILFFILAVCNLSALLILLKIGFLAFMFFIVYIGAISILFLFIIMLLNIRILDLKENILNYFPINITLCVILASQLFLLTYKELTPNILNTYNSWLEAINEITEIETIGLLIYTYYYYFFFIIGLILLVAMLNSIMLTLSHKKFVRRQDLFNQINKSFEKTILLKNIR